MTRGRLWLIQAGALLLFLLLWEALGRWGGISPILFSYPGQMLAVARANARLFLGHLGVTLAEILASIVLCWTFGILAGLFIGSRRALTAVLRPLVASLFAIPFVILYPLFLAWFGIGSLSKIVFGAAYGFFPIVLNTVAGVASIDRRYLLLSRSLGATPWQTLRKLLFPLALPSVVSGLRVGTGLVIIGVVVTEMLASVAGLGFLISYHYTLYDTGHVYLSILLSLLLAIVANALLSRLERRVAGWSPG